MDIFRLNFKSILLRGILSKVLKKIIYIKFGYKVDIDINDIDIDMKDDIRIDLNLTANVDKKEFNKMIRKIDRLVE